MDTCLATSPEWKGDSRDGNGDDHVSELEVRRFELVLDCDIGRAVPTRLGPDSDC